VGFLFVFYLYFGLLF